ncbi:MAG: protein transport protein bos1 [Watsoniomyces obsoletus]|nr:MAG: protein transport protein bos1 [Watsoniomyces obsoletus]
MAADHSPSQWWPSQPLHARDRPLALIILNQEVTNVDILDRLWDHADFRICADGGANRLYKAVEGLEKHDSFIPDEICGDLDSITPRVQEFYSLRNVKIVQMRKQDTTDFQKCVDRVREFQTSKTWPPSMDIVALGGLGGRVDQAFSLFHQLLKMARDESTSLGRIWLCSDTSMTFVLNEGLNIIHTPLGHGYFQKNVGILPVGQPATITTKGLEWDVVNWKTEFGHQVSTSNHVMSDILEITTSTKIFFTIELSEELTACECASIAGS